MKSSHPQNGVPSNTNNFDAIDGLIIGLIIFLLLVGVCLLAPMYFTTNLVLGLIKPAESKPVRASSNPVEDDQLNGQAHASQESNQLPRCRVS